LAIVAAAAGNAGAASSARYTWGSAAAVTVDQEFGGPGVYTQTLSAAGLSGTITGFHLFISTGPTFWSAWHCLTMAQFAPNGQRFGGTDCHGIQVFSISPLVAGATAIPGLTLSGDAGANPGSPVDGWISIDGTIDPPFTADPAVRYGLVTFAFDHSSSVIGPGDATHCGDADRVLCFFLQSGSLRRSDSSTEGMVPENATLSWQNPAGTLDCSTATPAQGTTWGRLKSIYR
jgi:hypothetical protein